MTSPTRVLTLPENEGNNPPVREVFWSPDATQLATIAGRTLSIWDAATGEQVRTISVDDNLADVDWSPDGQHLAACTAHYVRVYSMADGE
jgi:WD40 repeat protein